MSQKNRAAIVLSNLLTLLCTTALVANAARPPDVLIVVADQWSPRYLSWDDPQVRTPNLDRIARRSTLFDACYTTSPICMPARISLVTGLYPHDHGHGMWGNGGNYFVAPESATMFQDIRRAGYATAQIGKLHWFSGGQWRQRFKSLDEYHAAIGLDYVVDVAGPPSSASERNPYAKYLAERGLLDSVSTDLHDRYVRWEFEPRASVVGPDDYHDTFVTRCAIEWVLRQPRDKPLCLVLSLHSPHPPLDAPGEFATMYDPQSLKLPENVPESFTRDDRELAPAEVRRMLANYLGKIALVDRCIGEVVEAFEQRGTWDDAMFVLTADHGEMMGAHGALTKGRFYEESARVPLVVHLPGQSKQRRVAAPVQMFDVYPTVIETIGGEVSPGRFAASLVPLASGKKQPPRELAISEIGKSPPLNIMARNARYKWWLDGREEYLFDLENDPLEMRNLAGRPEHRETTNRMRDKLLDHLRSTQVNLAEGYQSKVQRLRAEQTEKAR
ncbi:MAG TPA: sulfatase-like hydrolase/transferase [Pirellulales bacterium]|nr:sulfatase-like hydrolase/transferase [Pirellulales bacterium]